MLEWVRPGQGGTGEDAPRWPKWSQAEREAYGFPETMPLRLSMDEIHEFNRKDKAAGGNRRRRNQDREDAWVAKRREQKEWFERIGLEGIRERRRGFLGEKRGIERDLLALAMTMKTGEFGSPPLREWRFV